MKTKNIEYEITEDSEIFPVIQRADEETAIGTQMGKRLTFKGSEYFMFVRAEEREETGKTDFLLVCGVTGTRTSRVRWSIERCLDDFIECLEKRKILHIDKFSETAKAMHPEYAERIAEWRKQHRGLKP